MKPPVPTEPNSHSEISFAKLLKEHPRQQRKTLELHVVLARIAQTRSDDMAARNYISHTNPDGYGPDWLVEQAGFLFPYRVSKTGNTIESINAGYPTAQESFDGFMASSPHKRHLLGEHEFFRKQTFYGIGYTYLESSQWKYYWCILIAEQKAQTSGE